MANLSGDLVVPAPTNAGVAADDADEDASTDATDADASVAA